MRERLGIPSRWWLGVPVAGFIYAILRWGLPILLQRMADGDDRVGSAISEFLVALSETAAPYATILFLVWWVAQMFQEASASRRLDRQSDIASIQELSWSQFEELLGEFFKRKGYRVIPTGPGPDGGVDLVLDNKQGRTLVQAKHWRTHSVGVAKVRELFGVQTARGARRSILVTSGSATSEARAFARSNGIEIIEGKQLEKMIRLVQRPVVARRRPSTRQRRARVRCPSCQAPMVRRVARRGSRKGQPFWGCSRFPDCRGVIDISR